MFDVCVMTGAPVARDAGAAALNSRSAGSFGSFAVPTLMTPQRTSVPSVPGFDLGDHGVADFLDRACERDVGERVPVIAGGAHDLHAGALADPAQRRRDRVPSAAR